MVRLNRVINAASPNKLGFTTAARTKISEIGRPIPNWSGILPADQSPLRGVIFEKYILVFQIQIFGFEYKIQEGLKPDRNNAREGRIVGRDAMRRALGAASALLTRRYHAARRPRGGPIGYSADRAGGAIPADVCAHTVAHRSWCLTPGRSALPRTPLTGVFRSSGADGSMLPRIPSSEGSTGTCQATASRASASLPADAWPRRLQGEQRPNYAARTHETRHRAF